MTTGSRDPHVHYVGNSPERILRSLRILGYGTNPLKDLDMADTLPPSSLLSVGKTQLLKILETLQRISQKRRRLKKKEMSENEYCSPSQIVYITSEDVQNMIEAVLRAHEEFTLKLWIDNTVNKKVHHSFKNADGKDLIGTYTTFYEMVRRVAANAIYLRQADDQIKNIILKLTESQDFTQHVINRLILHSHHLLPV